MANNPPISISGKDFRLTPALKEYVETKLGRLAKYHPKIQRIGVEFDVDRHHRSGDLFRVEVWIQIPGNDIKAGVNADDILASVDLVYPKLERQLVKAKEKPRTRRRTTS